ncbi:MAG: protein TolR [Caulobacterales bacterium 32-69-10]|nr:MAG: protein TolR [Caulobacterales bacterium 32-69-10]
MALSTHDPMSVGGRGGRRRRRGRQTLSEINVTPLVDVMLVLLIIFMISAPLLTVGVPVELPKTEAGAMSEQTEPLTISIQKDGTLFLQETETPFSDLAVRLQGLAGNGFDKPIFVRADGAAPYAVVAQVMARLSTNGFTTINLITDTGAPDAVGTAAPIEGAAVPSEQGPIPMAAP